MICLIGKTASGKDTIAKELVNKYGYKRIVTYTTRPIRDGEKEGVNYYYISIYNHSSIISFVIFKFPLPIPISISGFILP